MRRLAFAFGLVALALPGFGLVPARAGEAEVAPYQAIRALQALQDRIASGDTIAQAAHAKTIVRTARAFARMNQATWADPRNARALVVYLFSGGSAPTIAQAIPRGALAAAYQPLFEGALAYGLGDDDRARAVLLPLDATAQPAGLAGHLALLQGTLYPPADKAKAIDRLDLARLLEPGSLVEEAALRKEISLLGPDGDVDKLMLLTRRYESGFGQSVYADNFKQMMAELALAVAAADNDAANAKLERLLGSIGKDARRRIYLAIARRATIAGHLAAATFAAERGGALATHGEKDEARALVYLGAASIVGARYDTAIRALDAAAPDRLDARDQALRTSALEVAALIRRAATPGDGGSREQEIAVFKDGERAMADAAAVLAGATK